MSNQEYQIFQAKRADSVQVFTFRLGSDATMKDAAEHVASAYPYNKSEHCLEFLVREPGEEWVSFYVERRVTFEAFDLEPSVSPDPDVDKESCFSNIPDDDTDNLFGPESGSRKLEE